MFFTTHDCFMAFFSPPSMLFLALLFTFVYLGMFFVLHTVVLFCFCFRFFRPQNTLYARFDASRRGKKMKAGTARVVGGGREVPAMDEREGAEEVGRR